MFDVVVPLKDQKDKGENPRQEKEREQSVYCIFGLSTSRALLCSINWNLRRLEYCYVVEAAVPVELESW